LQAVAENGATNVWQPPAQQMLRSGPAATPHCAFILVVPAIASSNINTVIVFFMMFAFMRYKIGEFKRNKHCRDLPVNTLCFLPDLTIL
jgi:hypothetical protein